jgi:hypothetical protein
VIHILKFVLVNADVDEAEHAAHEHWPQRQQHPKIGAVRDFEFQHRGGDDGGNAVAEGFEKLLLIDISPFSRWLIGWSVR